MDINHILQHAIQLIESGAKTEGRDLLKQAILAKPNNPDVWFIYAQYCGQRDQAIDSLERVLLLEPYYPQARELLESISPPEADFNTNPVPAPVLTGTPNPWQRTALPANSGTASKKTPAKGKKRKIPRWFLFTGIGLTLFLCVGLIAVGALLTLNHGSTPAAAAAPALTQPTAAITETALPTPTLYIYHTPTVTADPCTCETVNTYLQNYILRVNQMLADADLMKEKMDNNIFTPQDAVITQQSAGRLYDEQHAENPPYCLASFQKEAVQMFWTWKETTQAIKNADINGALGFLQVIHEETDAIDKKMDKVLALPNLQACNLVIPTPIIPGN